jgi:hypothetical protein
MVSINKINRFVMVSSDEKRCDESLKSAILSLARLPIPPHRHNPTAHSY